jgi:HPt (histidine-containing phosphotransfer) domain-containing protein
MPVMDGIEAAAEIMKLGTGIPIVAMTANIMTSDMELYKLSGMSDCVGKPFTSQELWRCLLKYIKPSAWQQEDAGQTDKSDYELHQRLIKNFVSANSKKCEEISDAINSGDIKLAHRLAHTLKGNAGQLGKTLLQQAAEAVERNLANGGDRVTPQQMAALKLELSVVMKEFAPKLDKLAAEAPGSLEKNEADELLARLELLLRENNPESLKLVSGLHLIPGSEKLIRQIEDFDFGLAVNTAAELRKDRLS